MSAYSAMNWHKECNELLPTDILFDCLKDNKRSKWNISRFSTIKRNEMMVKVIKRLDDKSNG